MSVHSVELFRQNEAHKARQARLWGKKGAEPVKPAPIAISEPQRKLVQLDYHVWLYRLYLIYFPKISTSASFHIELNSEYQPYEPHVEFAHVQSERQPLRQSMKEITLEVLKDFPNVTLEIIRESSRKDNAVVIPRQLAMYEIRKRQPGRSFPEIGRFFNRDHTVAIHSFLKWDSALNDNEESKRRFNRRKERNAASQARIRALKAKQQSGDTE